MEIVGGGTMHTYPPEDELPHQRGVHEDWQESFVLGWWDAKQSVGGWFRLGQAPNYAGGETAIWTNVFTPEAVFHRAAHLPLHPQDKTKNGFNSADGSLCYSYDGQIQWTVNEKDISASLRVEDFHAAIDGYKRGGKPTLGDYLAHHVDSACRVTGSLTVKGKFYEVNGLGIRDHGWGIRHWGTLLSHRWTAGVFDDSSSFCTLCFHTTDDKITKLGWVIRGDKVIYASELDVVTYTECDGITNRGGVTRITLETGEVVDVKLDPLAPSVMSYVHGMAAMDTVCRVSWGERIGMGMFESSSNLQQGSRQPKVLDRGLAADGWYPGVKQLA